jgi:hypothetical protein
VDNQLKKNVNCARRALRAAALETLESRRLLCADHFLGGAANPLAGAYDPNNPDVIDTRVVVKTNGFEPAPGDDVVAAAAPGMPDLNSRPGAPTAIYLDFDGDAGTATNPYTDDADGTTFNASEAAIVTAAWQEMSTYFAMFDVNITTTQPAAGMPTAWVAIGNNISNGYSEVGPFPNSGSKAHSWVNSSFAKNRVSGIAHEIGHNFGLQHQSDWSKYGVKVNEYSSGYDSLHGPIMGVDFAQSVHKWFIGHSATSASSVQDDLAVIGNRIKPYQPAGGDGFRIDDIGNTFAAASALTLSGSTYSASGVIERVGDTDAFTFTLADAAAMDFLAMAHSVSAVDLKLGVYASDGTLLAMKDPSTNSHEMTLALAPGTYYAMLSSHGNYGDVGMYDFSVRMLPGGWDTRDIGTPSQPGTATATADATPMFTVKSFGTTVDSFRFAYQTLTGDGSITARVDSLTGVNQSPGGVMIREALTTNSKFVWAQVSGGGPGWSYRTTTGGGVTNPAGTNIAQPYWLRLTRSGGNVIVAKSPDGVAWTDLQTIAFSSSSTLFVGLAVSALTSAGPATATFSNVAFTGTLNAPPAYNALPAPSGVAVAPQATNAGFTVSWNDVSGESGYLIERSSDGVDFTTASSVNANVTSYNDNAPSGSLRYFYRVSARGDANTTRSAPSAPVSALNRPSAVTNMKFMSLTTTQVAIDWRDTDGETGYRVERSADGGVNWSTLTTLAANVPTYIANGLTQGVTYQFRITPTSAQGDGVAATISAQTRLNAVSGVAFGAIQSNQAKINWTANVPFATGYRVERSGDGTNFTTVANLSGAAVSSWTDPTVTALNKYFYRVIATNALTESVSTTTIRGATPASTPLPSGWTALDIGSISPGASGFTGGTATVIGSGSIVSAGSDTFQYLFQRTSGDGEMIARIATMETTSSTYGAGLMLRSSLGTTGNFAHLRVTASGIDLLARGGTISNTHVNVSAPIWLKLARSGTTVTGYYSTDGVGWTLVGTAAGGILAGNAFVGLTTTPQDSVSLVKATFDNLSGSMLNQPDTTAPSTPTFTSISNDTGSSALDRITSDNTLSLTGSAEAGSLITISRTDIGVIGTVQANYNGNFSFDYTATVLADGAYTFTATAKDASNNLSPTSNSFAVTIDTLAPTPIGWTFNVASQRVEVQYSEALNGGTVTGADIGLVNATTGQSFSVSSGIYTAATRTAAYGTGAALIDGEWHATLNAAAVSDPAGNILGGPYEYAFYYAAGSNAADAYTIRLAPGGASFEIVEGAQQHTVTRAGLQKIFLDPFAGTDSLHLDFSAGIDWMPPQGLAIGQMESARVTGGPGAQTFTFAGDLLTSGAWHVDLTTVQSLTLAASGVTLASDLAGRALSAESGAAVNAQSDLRLATLAITGNAVINVNDHDLVVRNTPIADIESLIRSGALTSTLIDESGANVLGSGPAGAIFGIAGSETALFAGQTVVASDICIKYTWAGDANLDGVLDGGDYGVIDNFVQVPGASGYWNGDFNYDGAIDGGDYGILDNFIQTNPPPI